MATTRKTTVAPPEPMPEIRALAFSFPLRMGVTVTLDGLPEDLGPADTERLARWIKMLAPAAVEVCPKCQRGAAVPGAACPACGAGIGVPERLASRLDEHRAQDRAGRAQSPLAAAMRAEMADLVMQLGIADGPHCIDTIVETLARYIQFGLEPWGELTRARGNDRTPLMIAWTNAARQAARRIAERVGRDPGFLPADMPQATEEEEEVAEEEARCALARLDADVRRPASPPDQAPPAAGDA